MSMSEADIAHHQAPPWLVATGNETLTTDANGDVVVSHGLPSAPTVAIVSPQSRAPAAWVGVPFNYTDTTFTVRVVQVSNAALITGATVSFRWLARL